MLVVMWHCCPTLGVVWIEGGVPIGVLNALLRSYLATGADVVKGSCVVDRVDRVCEGPAIEIRCAGGHADNHTATDTDAIKFQTRHARDLVKKALRAAGYDVKTKEARF